MRDPAADDYLDARCGPAPDYLATVERNTHLRTVSPQMLGGHMQGRLLSQLTGWLRAAKPTGAFRVLEVGTFTGYSTLCFAERLGPGDELHTIEVNDEFEGLIRGHLALAGFDGSRPDRARVTLHVGDANALLPRMRGPWDLVYLDGRKEDYPAQFAAVSERLAAGGHVLLDNVLWDGQVLAVRPGSTAALLREFTLALARDARWETLLLPLRDGLMLVRRG